MYHNLRIYCQHNKIPLDEIIPQTFHVSGLRDPNFLNFMAQYNKNLREQESNIWIVKPGEHSNRGRGIEITDSIREIKNIVCTQFHDNGKPKTYIIQKYIDNPMLYNKRKFDFRCYVLVTSINGFMRAYWYEEGYVRTASEEFNSLDLFNEMIHLTNDAIQKHSSNYGKYENSNKLSFSEFNRYLEQQNPPVNFYSQIYPKLKE